MTAIWISLAVIAVVAGWVGHSWWLPFKRCPACTGRGGRGALSTPRAYNRCWRCKGTGERVRIGARAISKATGRPVRGSEKGK